MWDPDRYERFRRERARPFHDLLARIPARDFDTIVDLGCGSGELTRLLASRWPRACVLGVDASAAMLQRAAAAGPAPTLQFVQADLADWQPPRPVGLLFSNAALHWLPDHQALLPRLIAMLAPAGVLAVQMPDNFAAPSHRSVAAVAARPPWREMLASLPQRAEVIPLSFYAETLLQAGFDVDAWTTEYLHVLPGDDAVRHWLEGTTLRPHLAQLREPALQQRFLAEVGAELAPHYPRRHGVTLLPFRRLFFVATRASA